MRIFLAEVETLRSAQGASILPFFNCQSRSAAEHSGAQYSQGQHNASENPIAVMRIFLAEVETLRSAQGASILVRGKRDEALR
jgi:hypothetical protein